MTAQRGCNMIVMILPGMLGAHAARRQVDNTTVTKVTKVIVDLVTIL